MAYGIGQQKLCMHNWGMVNSFVWYIISVVVSLHCLALAEREDRKEQAATDLWPLEWFVMCVDGCIDTRGYIGCFANFIRANFISFEY